MAGGSLSSGSKFCWIPVEAAENIVAPDPGSATMSIWLKTCRRERKQRPCLVCGASRDLA